MTADQPGGRRTRPLRARARVQAGSIAAASVPADSVPADSVSADSVPADSVSADSVSASPAGGGVVATDPPMPQRTPRHGLGPGPLDLAPPTMPHMGAPLHVPIDLPAALPRRDRRRIGFGAVATDRFNRSALALLGLIVGAAGACGLLLGHGDLHWSRTPASLYREGASDAIGSVDLAAAVAMAVCLVALILGLRWALVQLRPVTDGPRMGSIRLGNGARGRTSVPSAGVARAAAADLASRPGIVSARVRLLAVLPAPRAIVIVELAVDADPEITMSEISAALGRLARVLEAETVDADLRIRFGKDLRSAKTSRVR